MSYPISVVVPTKNRYKYLKKLIELIIGFDTDEIELVIQDNSDRNQEILEFLNNKNYPWLKYYYCNEHLTSIENFDLAIGHTSGDYVCFIGDDDGVVRNIVDCAKWMLNNNIEAAITAKSVYVWPMDKQKAGILTIEHSSQLIEYLNPIIELKKTLKNGCQDLGKIPVTYTGIVLKRVLDQICRDCGTYFPGGASADIANGVALCFYVRRFVKVNMPVVITGTSAMTGGVKNRRAFVPFSQIPFIAKDYGLNWEGFFPKYWFGCFVWPESAIKSLRFLGKESFVMFLNANRAFANATIRGRVNPMQFKDFCPLPLLCYSISIVIFKRCYNAFKKRFIWLFLYFFKHKRYKKRNLVDIIQAEEYFSSFSFDILNTPYK